MQTLQDFLKITKNICKTLIYIALCICLTVNLSACKSVRIDNQALETSQKELELCNKIYSIAKRKQKIVDSENSGTDNSKSVISSKDASKNANKDASNTSKDNNNENKNDTSENKSKNKNNTSKDRSKNSSFGNKSKGKISESIKDSFLKETAKAWQEVAIQCDTKFAEATIKNAQIMLKLSQKSNNSSNNSSNKINDYAKNEEISAIKSIREFTHNNESLRLSHNPLAQAAAGEDRLAFILQTLAAKNLDKKLIKLSDNIASISNIFMHIAGNGEDVRKKTYNMPVDALSSGKTRDYTSTKTLDIAAISYMECAREELLAFNTSMYITAYNSKNEVEESDNSEEEISNKSENKSENKRLNEKDIVHKFKRILMKLVTSRLLRAYSLGYPTSESSSLTYKSSK